MSFEEFKRYYRGIDWRLLLVALVVPRKEYDMATRTTRWRMRPSLHTAAFALRIRTADREGFFVRGQWVWPWQWHATYYRTRFSAGR